MNRRIALAMMLPIALVVLAGCGAPGAKTPATAGSEAAEPEKVLESFWTASRKAGTYDSATKRADGEEYTETGEFWVDGRSFRIDYYREPGKLRISIISPDGKTAYFCDPEKQESRPAVAGVDHYLSEFNKPGAGKLDREGVDPETGGEKLRYVVKKTDTVAGAENPWYTEDYVYYVKGGDLLKLVSRGTNPEDDGSIGPLDEYTHTFTKLELDPEIPADTFKLPYPIKTE